MNGSLELSVIRLVYQQKITMALRTHGTTKWENFNAILSCFQLLETHASTNDNLPLTIRQENTIDLNRYILVDLIKDSSKLADKLYKKLVLNERQRDHVCDLHATRANEILLDILRRKSIQHYKATVRCLREIDQELAADILDGQGRIIIIYRSTLSDNNNRY